MPDIQRDFKPTGRLTRIGDRLINALEADPEYTDDIRGIIMLSDPKMSGVALTGYDRIQDDSAAIADLIMHLQAIMAANGKRLDMGFIGSDGSVEWAPDPS